MLGAGRPFLLELCNPRKYFFFRTDDDRNHVTKILEKICEEISCVSSKNVSVGNRLWLVKGPESSKSIKQGEGDKSKIYRALVSPRFPFSSSTKSFDSFVVNQKTPLRVLHRRSNLNRTRTVYDCNLVSMPGNECLFEMIIKTQAGMFGNLF